MTSIPSTLKIDVVVHPRSDINSTLAHIRWQAGRISLDVTDSSFTKILHARLPSLEMGRNQFEKTVRASLYDDDLSFTLSYQQAQSGWLILRTYQWILERFPVLPVPGRHYAIPTSGAPVPPIFYGGIDRPALCSLNSVATWADWTGNHVEGELEAIKEMTRIEDQGQSSDDLIATKDAAQSIMSRIVDTDSWECVWVSDTAQLSANCLTSVIGFEPSYLSGDHFSPLCDSMFLPRWHGSDESGRVFGSFFEALNERGLFSTPEDASGFLASYLQEDWAEKDGEYVIIAVGT